MSKRLTHENRVTIREWMRGGTVSLDALIVALWEANEAGLLILLNDSDAPAQTSVVQKGVWR